MRVLIINHLPLEGSTSGIYTKNLARELKAHGQDVMVMTPCNEVQKGYNFDVKTVVFKGVDESQRDVDFEFPCFTTHPKTNRTFFDLSDEELGIYMLVMERNIKEAIEDFKPDIVHCQHIWLIPYMVSKFDVPYVITSHGAELDGALRDDRYKKYVMQGIEHSMNVISVSKAVDRRVKVLYGIEDERRSVILNGFDEELFKMRAVNKAELLKSIGIFKDFKYVVSFVGRLARFKGVNQILRAASVYEKKDGDILTLIVGSGSEHEGLLRLKRELKLENLYFIPYKDQEFVSDIYNISDVFVAPSKQEGFGLAALEALGSGVPVVASNEGGFRDFINSEVGSLVNPDDYQEISAAIINELHHPEKDMRSAKAYKLAYENFSWKRVIEEIYYIYNLSLSNAKSMVKH